MSKTTQICVEEDVSSWKSCVWDTFDKSPEERRFLFKLDFALLTFATLGYFVKTLDQNNINSAFVSGMKEDLGLYKNELNYMQACWTVGYALGEIPSNLLLTRIRPRYWLPAMEIIWTILTFSLSKCRTPDQIYILRFFIGIALTHPSSCGFMDELAKRSCIFQASGAIATMLSGCIMAGAYKLRGVGGFKGWQWLFLIDGIASLPIGVLGFFLLPDVPEIANPWYLSREEVALARQRMRLEGRKGREPCSRAKLRKILLSWHLPLLVVMYICAIPSQPVFQQYYSVPNINLYPSGTYAVQVITTLAYAWLSDSLFRGRRWPPILCGGLVDLACAVPLAIWNISAGGKWTCYILWGAGYGLSGLCLAWAQEICSDDNEERALVVATMNTMSHVFQAWLPQLVWQQVDAPKYRSGFICCAAMAVGLLCMGTVTKVRSWLMVLIGRQEMPTKVSSDALGRRYRLRRTRVSGDAKLPCSNYTTPLFF
ncbi:major facilitator superfamily domain-containing protein [Aspergillus pseudodeflectus]|uniref:Major facilitator superfamily domain-containing protein n=1 Tax=Aspergillus pseudodeflectus TaxID=176178 RepID=A0ABR4K3U1_9EURO